MQPLAQHLGEGKEEFDKCVQRRSEIKFLICAVNNFQKFVLVSTVCLRTEISLLHPDGGKDYVPSTALYVSDPRFLVQDPYSTAQFCRHVGTRNAGIRALRPPGSVDPTECGRVNTVRGPEHRAGIISWSVQSFSRP